jgi:hypothetical protein
MYFRWLAITRRGRGSLSVMEDGMRKWLVGCAALAAFGLGAATASAEMASHSAMSSHMASSAGHMKETKTDVMMVNQCHAMSRRKMLKDAECQDYMKHHPDWMKHR